MLEQDHGPPSVLWKVRRQVSRHQNEFGVNYLGSLLELERGMAVWERAVSGIPYDNFRRSLRVASPRNFARARVFISPAPQSP